MDPGTLVSLGAGAFALWYFLLREKNAAKEKRAGKFPLRAPDPPENWERQPEWDDPPFSAQ